MTQPQPEIKTVKMVLDEKTLTVSKEHLVLYRGQDVIFEYPGEKGAVLFFPVQRVFPCRAVDMEPGPVWRLKLTVRSDAPLGEFAYAIYSRDLDDYAVAASPPRIIITDPNKPNP